MSDEQQGKEFKVYKIGTTIPRPSEEDIELARIYAESFGGVFLEQFEKNMKVLEGK